MTTEVAKIILFDRYHQVLIYLRDDKPTIPYPSHWDLLGGLVEKDESPEEAVIREVDEEVGVRLERAEGLCQYLDSCFIYHIFRAEVDVIPEELTLTEGQGLTSIDLVDRINYKFAPVLQQILDDFAERL